MEGLRRSAILLTLIEELQAQGSWSGETHIQKSTYFLQGLTGVPLDLRFILYKHGPFSFDLRAELAAMHAKSLVGLRVQPYPYGPSLVPGPSAGLLKKIYPVTSRRYRQQIEFIARKLGPRRVVELEKLATGLYVMLEEKASGRRRATRIHQLKPHVSLVEAQASLAELDEILHDASAVSAAAAS